MINIKFYNQKKSLFYYIMSDTDLHCILYFSSMRIKQSKDSLSQMLSVFQKKNFENNISGLMLYVDGNVIQYIEGDKEVINRLYTNIKNDNRHTNIIKILDEKILTRYFAGWGLASKEISLEDFEKLSIVKDEDTNSKKINIFFKNFLSSFHNSFIYTK